MSKPVPPAGGKQRPSPYPRPANPGQLSKKPPIPVRFNKPPSSPSISTSPPVEHVPVNDLVQAARKAFSDKDFASALHLLTRALNVAPKDINLLDSRAACCEKLGRFNDALMDAKTMIQLHPRSPKVRSASEGQNLSKRVGYTNSFTRSTCRHTSAPARSCDSNKTTSHAHGSMWQEQSGVRKSARNTRYKGFFFVLPPITIYILFF